VVNGKLKFADPIALFIAPVGRLVGDGSGFLFPIIISIVHIPHTRRLCGFFFVCSLGLVFRNPPFDGSYIMPDPQPPSTQPTNPLSVLSADRSQSLNVTPRFVVLSPSYLTSAVTYILVV